MPTVREICYFYKMTYSDHVFAVHRFTSLCYLSTIKTSIHVLMAKSYKYYLAQGGILGVSVAQGTTYRVGILEAHTWKLINGNLVRLILIYMFSD